MIDTSVSKWSDRGRISQFRESAQQPDTMEARLQALTAAFHTPMAAARDARYQGDVVGSTRVSSSFDGDVLLGNGTDAEHPHPEDQVLHDDSEVATGRHTHSHGDGTTDN